MDPRTIEADTALDAFRASQTDEGRFLSYSRGRSRHFLTRQVVLIILFPVVFFVGGLGTAFVAALASLLGDALDSFVLHRLGHYRTLGHKLPRSMGLATLTAGVQALTNAFCIALIYELGGSDIRTLAGAVCFAGILDAALLYSAHRGTSVVRILVYLASVSTIVLWEWMGAKASDSALLFESFSMVFLLAVCWLIVRHVLKTQERRIIGRMGILEKSRELAHANVALEHSRQATRRLAMVAERANDSVIITDSTGTISWVNSAFSRVTGYAFEEAIGRGPSFLNGPETDPAAAEALQRARVERRPIRLEIVNHRRDGRPIWIEVNMNPVFDERGELLNVVSIERDIGEAKEREAALAEARKQAEDAVRVRHNFLATMSHEIRTPMNGVIGTTDLLLETELDAQQQELLGTINASGEALLAIINDILDFSKLESGRFEVEKTPFSPRDCLRGAVDLVQPLADSKNLPLALSLPTSLPATLIGDCRRLSQVLLNLLGNAIKFTETGRVDMDVSMRLELGRCHLSISVCDTGVGIPSDRLDSIFESFVQAESTVAGRFGGTGLGLAISRLLVDAMGGDISVSSVPSEGSVFCVSLALPVAGEVHRSAAIPSEEPVEMDLGLAGSKVLVAEDNRTNTLLIERTLRSVGVEPILVGNGRAAVDAFATHRPASVFMDVHMPILDGLEATRRIRAFEATAGQPATPIVALTANAFPEDQDLCRNAGMDAVMTKPFRKRDLVATLQGFLPCATGPEVAAKVTPHAPRTG